MDSITQCDLTTFKLALSAPHNSNLHTELRFACASQTEVTEYLNIT